MGFAVGSKRGSVSLTRELAARSAKLHAISSSVWRCNLSMAKLMRCTSHICARYADQIIRLCAEHPNRTGPKSFPEIHLATEPGSVLFSTGLTRHMRILDEPGDVLKKNRCRITHPQVCQYWCCCISNAKQVATTDETETAIQC